jgi:hypothetical protein
MQVETEHQISEREKMRKMIRDMNGVPRDEEVVILYRAEVERRLSEASRKEKIAQAVSSLMPAVIEKIAGKKVVAEAAFYAGVCQLWEESERGWGVRPDGFSLHFSLEEHAMFLAAYYENEKKRNPSGEVPDEYSRVCGEPYACKLTAEQHEDLLKAASEMKHGRFYSSSTTRPARIA